MSTTPSLDILAELRREAGLSQSEMARLCGLRGRRSHQTAGAWERGDFAPDPRRRLDFIYYLWDGLGLRRNPQQFEEVWTILAGHWGWEAIDDDEWRRFTNTPRPSWAVETTSERRVPFQAPPLSGHFLGRRAEQDRLQQSLLADPPMGVVALTGMGGIGKTTLAVRAAHELRVHFGDGVLWGNPALSDAAAILDSWGQAYGYDFSRLPDAASKAAAFRDLAASRRVLIVLDDLLSAESVRLLLPGSPTSAVILTTRNQDVAHALHAEIFPLAPLDAESSRDLLSQLVGSARVAAEADAVDAICTLLDHLPLAVEIAGQRLRARPDRRLADFADRLRSVQALLAELRISDRAVRTSFEASWQALDDDLRRSFAQLSLFAARPFDVDAFTALSALDPYDAEEALFSLVALSLLIDAGGRRYRLHPLLADFAREKFADAPDADAIWLRFARHFAQIAEKAATLAIDAPEWEHITVGIQSAHELGAHDLLFAYVDVLLDPWRRQGHFTQARRCLSLTVSAARRGDDPRLTARYLREWGFFCLEQDDYPAAAPLLAEAVEIFAALEEAGDRAETQLLQARMAVEQDQYAGAEAILRDCWAVFAGMDEGRGLARTLYWQGLVYYYQGKYDEAKQLQIQARSLQEALGEQAHLIATLRSLADTALQARAHDEAESLCQLAFNIAAEIGDHSEEAAIYYLQATIAGRRQAWRQALAYADKALATFRRLGDLGFQALVLYQQSQIQLKLDKHGIAEDLALKSRTLAQSINQKHTLVYVLRHLSRVYAASGRADNAEEVLRQALQIAESDGHLLVDALRQQLATLHGETANRSHAANHL